MFAADMPISELLSLVIHSSFWAGLLGGISGTFALMLIACLFRMWESRHDA